MEESAISNSKNSTISTKRSTADLTAVPLLHAMLDQLRSELATVRVALDSERSAVRALKRDRAAEIKGVREEEARKRRDALSDLKSRLERDHEDALQRQKDAITKTLNAELLRSMKTKDMEVRHELSEVHAREESLKQQVREALRANRDSRSQQQANANIGEINKLQQEVSTLRAQNKHLEERYQMMVEADRQKAVDLRSQHEEHELELNSIKKNSKQEIHRLLEELKSKDRLISQLEKQLNVQTGQAEKQQLEYLENRKINTMDKKTASPKSKILRQTGENTESLSEEEEFPDTFYPYILKDSFELMCDQQPLQSRRKREAAERIILEHELATARTKIRELKRMLIEQRGGSVAMAERISSLQAEVHELREQNELLEFRILELEECHESASIKSHSPDTRTDTESDSGILSLPNSDDVGTDTDLGIYDISVENPLCKIPEHSPSKLLSRIIAKVLPFTDSNVNTSNDNGEDCNHSKKKLSNTDHLQESGIFEEDDFNTQSTQTDDILVLDEDANEFKSLLENGEVGDLSTEIKKLTQFRELVEERANYCESKKLIRVDEGKGDLPQGSCASHIKELQYYKERVQVLEDKVVLYESSDDTKVHLLAKRLQTELNLSAQVKELTDRVNRLSNLNRQLEEEKCEFEEAENDTRLKCQKLEMKIVALNEKRSDLQAQLQQERRNMNRLRTSLSESERKRQETKGQLTYIETMLNKYEHRNYELEEREVELRHRLEMLETTLPALLIWNMWYVTQEPNVSRAAISNAVFNSITMRGQEEEPPATSSKYRPITSTDSKHVYSSDTESHVSDRDEQTRLRELEDDLNRTIFEKHEAEENWKTRERELTEELRFLESKERQLAEQIKRYNVTEKEYKEKIQKLTKELETNKEESLKPILKEVQPTISDEITKAGLSDMSVSSLGCESLECVKKIQELVQSGLNLKKYINELEIKERAYMETLQQADELWSEMENSYKAHIEKAEDSEASLKEKIKKLEDSETKLQQTYKYKEENYLLMERIQNFEQNEKEFKERIQVLESEKNNLLKERTQLRDALMMTQTELQKTKELVEGPLKEDILKERKLSKMLQEEIKTMEKEMEEASAVHDTNVSGLKAQMTKMSHELVDMECTNSELKEEVETLETKVCELKSSLEFQKISEEKMIIQMSQTILEKEKELEIAKKEMQYAKIPSAHDELKEALPGLAEQETESKSFPEKSVCLKPCDKDCTCPNAQVTLLPPPLSQKPVLRRWLHQEKEWRQW